jgi:hypothetical protein
MRKTIKTFIDRRDLAGRNLAENTPHCALVYRSEVIDQSERPLRETAASGRERWIKETLAGCARDRHDTHEREPLIACDFRITDHHARPHTAVFVSIGWIKFDDDHRTIGPPFPMHCLGAILLLVL